MSTATVGNPDSPKCYNLSRRAPEDARSGGRRLEAASGETFPTYNPATGEVLAQVAEEQRPTSTGRSPLRGKPLERPVAYAHSLGAWDG